MDKKTYTTPSVRIRLIDSEEMICNSDPSAVSSPPSDQDPINSGVAESKQNVSQYNVWETEDEEQ